VRAQCVSSKISLDQHISCDWKRRTVSVQTNSLPTFSHLSSWFRLKTGNTPQGRRIGTLDTASVLAKCTDVPILACDWTIDGYSGSARRRNWSGRDCVKWLLSYNNLLFSSRRSRFPEHARWQQLTVRSSSRRHQCHLMYIPERAHRRHAFRALSKSKPMQYQDFRIISHLPHFGTDPCCRR
jgi:hypothetical protein